jgi:diguanylate cyclase (GGDEF)-like protein/PAS domain S-box-containing protein
MFMSRAGVVSRDAPPQTPSVRAPSRAAWWRTPRLRERRSTARVEAYLRSAFEDAPIGMALVSIQSDTAGSILHVNRALGELTGFTSSKLKTSNMRALLHPDDTAADDAAMARLSASEIEGFQLEQRLLHAHREPVWVNVNAALVRDDAGKPLYCIRQMHDIEERKRYEGELGYLAEHDPLTGLLNRRGFLRELTHEMAYASRYGSGGSILFLDVDDLKNINDTRGHDVGDEVLSEVGRIVGARLRETDSLARLGGDEFVVLLPHTGAAAARALAVDLLSTVRDGCCVALTQGRRVALSIGIKGFHSPSAHQTAEDLLVDADDAMYSAKEAGKNRVSVAGAIAQDRTEGRVTWAERVRRAVRENLFELYCQPIVDLSSDEVTQWELLLRLPGENGELFLPAQFLYTAERSGLIIDVDRWVVGAAIRLLSEHRQAGHALCLEVNISGRSVGDAGLLKVIEEGLKETGVDPASLVLEVTETAAIANIERARGFATTLKTLGCGFALDDFGAGFGSFYYLKHIPFDYVKIDGEFIRDLASSSTDRLILDSIVQMSTALDKRTIAEFVGDEMTVELLRAAHVDYGQGFHLGRPRPVSEALAA